MSYDTEQTLDQELTTALDVYVHLRQVFSVDVTKLSDERDLWYIKGQQALLAHLEVKLNITKD